MKIRCDFVTNSSSSCYIIAYKDFKLDQATLKKYPILTNFSKLFNEVVYGTEGSIDTSSSMVVSTQKELADLILRAYGNIDDTFEDVCNRDDYAVDVYNSALRAIKDGYKVVGKYVGFDDSIRATILNFLQSDSFVILNDPEY